MTPPTNIRIAPITYVGLFLSLFGLAFFTSLYRDWFGISIESVFIREMVIFLMVGILLGIIHREGLTTESVGLRTSAIGKSLGYGMLFFLFSAVGILICAGAMSVLGWKIGGNDPQAFQHIPIWLWFIIVVRAGVAEELFYRGYAIERLYTITGRKWLAISIPLVIFAIGHYRQGPGGILISFVAGGILTATYLWKRDLLANMIAHFTVDFVPNVLLPLLGISE